MGRPYRFFGGVALFKEGKAQKLVFTGGKMPWDKAKKTEGEVLKEYAISSGIPTEKMFVTKDVDNTADEAVAVKELISPSKRIILVTSAYHMSRARKHFEKQGFLIISYKVDFKTSQNKGVGIIDFLPSLDNLGETETAIREIIGGLLYLVKG